MSRYLDLAGQRFGRLVVLHKVGKSSDGRIIWHCKCDCGNYKDVTSHLLRSGDAKSCGCLQRETRVINASRLDNKKHGMSHSRLYRIYHNMISRCYRKCTRGYENYGGRGISVCDEWLGENGFVNFMKWAVLNGYNDNLTIDILDSNGN